jgi:outer membrane protein TolC
MKLRFNEKMILLFLMFAVPAEAAMDLQGFLSKVRNHHKGIKAVEIGKEAAEDRREAGDINLVPTLTLKGSQLSDKKQPNFFGDNVEAQTETYTLGLGKKFSTGTNINLSASTLSVENLGDIAVPFADFAKYAQGSLGVSISQSLWRDFFGRGTRLRREREEYQSLSEKTNLSLQERMLLIEAESLYWDNLYLKEELAAREASLKRAQKIDRWMKRRVANGIGDRADALNAQALAASRELQLLMTRDELTANQKKIRDFLELDEKDPLPVLDGKIDQERNLKDLFRTKKRIIKLEAYLAELEAKTKGVAAEEVYDSQRPDLALTGSYNTNSYEQFSSNPFDGTDNWQDTDKPTTNVALTFSYTFDTGVKSSAKKDAMAAEFRRQRKVRESDTAWQELIRRDNELSKKVAAAKLISQLQTSRARAEDDKLDKGRTTTSNVIQSEQDAAEAELNLIKLMAEQRKLEAQSQLFIVADEL